MNKPPLGIKPRFIHEGSRLSELRGAMQRYLDKGLKISVDWIVEYNELTNKKTEI